MARLAADSVRHGRVNQSRNGKSRPWPGRLQSVSVFPVGWGEGIIGDVAAIGNIAAHLWDLRGRNSKETRCSSTFSNTRAGLTYA